MPNFRADCILKLAFLRTHSDYLILSRKAILLEEELRGPFVRWPIVLLILRIAIDVKGNELSLVCHAYLARKGYGKEMFGVGKTDFLFELQKGVVVFETSRVRTCLEVFEKPPGLDFIVFLCDSTRCYVQLKRGIHASFLLTVNVGS